MKLFLAARCALLSLSPLSQHHPPPHTHLLSCPAAGTHIALVCTLETHWPADGVTNPGVEWATHSGRWKPRLSLLTYPKRECYVITLSFT